MKSKLFICCTLFLALLICNACEEPVSPNRFEDTTKLWPAADSTGAKVGYINAKGKMVIPAQYKEAYFFSGGVAKVVTFDNQIRFINPQGAVVYTQPSNESIKEDYFYNGYIRFYTSEGEGLYDSNFNITVPTIYSELGKVSKEGFVRFYSVFRDENGTWKSDTAGYLNIKGNSVFHDLPDGIFVDGLSDFCDGRAVVAGLTHSKEPDVYWLRGAINTNGELVIDTMYQELRHLGGGLLAYKSPESAYYGLMDIDGNVITEEVFYGIKECGENELYPMTYSYENEGPWGYVDKTGNVKIEPSYTYCYPFHEGVAWVYYHDSSKELGEGDIYKLIDTNGHVLWELKNTQYPLTYSHNGLMLIAENYKDGNRDVMYVDKKQNVVYKWKWYNWYPWLME